MKVVLEIFWFNFLLGYIVRIFFIIFLGDVDMIVFKKMKRDF